jgi:hypothetical protein
MKNLKINFFALAAVAIAVGTMSFKAANHRAEITRWHIISTNGANQQQDIVGMVASDPTEGGNCESELESVRCAVQLKYDESYNPVGNTVNQVETASGNSALDRTFKPEE